MIARVVVSILTLLISMSAIVFSLLSLNEDRKATDKFGLSGSFKYMEELYDDHEIQTQNDIVGTFIFRNDSLFIDTRKAIVPTTFKNGALQ